MAKNNKKQIGGKFEKTTLVVLTLAFVAVVGAAWFYALKLRQTITASNAVIDIDSRALIEVEKLRNVVDSQIANSRSFFLLGSKALFDEQKKEKDTFQQALATFAKTYSLPEIPGIIKNIESLEAQQDDIFDQAMKFREKQTESKIVGQFYQSKTAPIRAHINQALDEIVRVHNEDYDHARNHARERKAALDAQIQIPRGMAWFTGATGFLFLCMSFLVIRLLWGRRRSLAERDRLYQEAQKAIQGRDEIIVAISQDLNEPLAAIARAADALTKAEPEKLTEQAETIKNSVTVTEGLIKDIQDQAKSDMGNMTLRLDQLSIDAVLDDARLMLQSLAKQRDVRLQFDTVNPPVLAFLDRERVMRVLSNLVGNAIKFSPKHSKIVIKVRSDQQFVYISVADSGPGIPEKILPDIFEHFWQARNTAEQGAGVGLAIVKTIIEAHGGTVRVDSQSGQGSTFTFSLPRRRPVGAHIGRPATMVKTTSQPQGQIHEGPTL